MHYFSICFLWFLTSLQGSSVCSNSREGLGVWTVVQVPLCTHRLTTCVYRVCHRVGCPQLSRDTTDSSIPPWCSLSYRDRSAQTHPGFTAWKKMNRCDCGVKYRFSLVMFWWCKCDHWKIVYPKMSLLVGQQLLYRYTRQGWAEATKQPTWQSNIQCLQCIVCASFLCNTSDNCGILTDIEVRFYFDFGPY